jgi:hypothetical protein
VLSGSQGIIVLSFIASRKSLEWQVSSGLLKARPKHTRFSLSRVSFSESSHLDLNQGMDTTIMTPRIKFKSILYIGTDFPYNFRFTSMRDALHVEVQLWKLIAILLDIFIPLASRTLYSIMFTFISRQLLLSPESSACNSNCIRKYPTFSHKSHMIIISSLSGPAESSFSSS